MRVHNEETVGRLAALTHIQEHIPAQHIADHLFLNVLSPIETFLHVAHKTPRAMATKREPLTPLPKGRLHPPWYPHKKEAFTNRKPSRCIQNAKGTLTKREP
eukprot:scaffold115678_cov14-Tisochrysis_lutea.AAC.1